MTTFINAEFVIAYTLISKLSKGLDVATFHEVRQFAAKLQGELDKNNIDAIVISHGMPDAVEQFNEYFDTIVLNNCSYIKCRREVGLTELKSRFVGFLPVNIINIVNKLLTDPVTEHNCYSAIGAINLFLVRHGESIQNTGDNFEMRLPDHAIYLTQQGHEQAELAGKALRDWCIDNLRKHPSTGRMWVSPYTRTRQTAEELNKSLGIKDIREDDMLTEMQFGLFANMPKSKAKKQFPVEWEAFQNNRRVNGKFYARRPDGESPFDCMIRQRLFIDTLFRDINYGTCPEIVVIVGHGAQISCFRKAMFHYNYEWYEKEPNASNCSIQHIIINNKNNKDAGYIYGYPLPEK